jgi:hypothetical protein
MKIGILRLFVNAHVKELYFLSDCEAREYRVLYISIRDAVFLFAKVLGKIWNYLVFESACRRSMIWFANLFEKIGLIMSMWHAMFLFGKVFGQMW